MGRGLSRGSPVLGTQEAGRLGAEADLWLRLLGDGRGDGLCFARTEERGHLWASQGYSGGDISGSSKSWPLVITLPCAQIKPLDGITEIPGEGWGQEPECLQLGGRPIAPELGRGHV